MDPASLRIEFEKQLKDSDTKIAKAEEQLAKLKEYRLKLQGGMETIDLLSQRTRGAGRDLGWSPRTYDTCT